MRAKALKRTVNDMLYRTTGHVLTRETPPQRARAIEQARRRTAEKLRWKLATVQSRHQRELAEQRTRIEEELRVAAAEAAREAQAEREARRERGAHLPSHLDDVKRRIIAQVSPRTMTGVPKLDPLVEAVRYVVREQIPGDVVECGVWRGGSMQAVALTLLSLDDTTRELHLFDTFEGMPPPTEEDTRRRPSGEVIRAADSLAGADRDARVWAVAGLNDVEVGMAETGYPAARIHLHPGMVEATTPQEAPERIAILRLDTDWYASTKHELEVLYDRLSPGGILILDDYGDWDGARKATDEWLETTRAGLFLTPIGPGRIAVKPRS